VHAGLPAALQAISHMRVRMESQKFTMTAGQSVRGAVNLRGASDCRIIKWKLNEVENGIKSFCFSSEL
jgi:hypothetical protein